MIYGSVVEQWSASCGVVLSFTSAIYSNIWHITTITAKVNEKSSSQLVHESALSLVVIYGACFPTEVGGAVSAGRGSLQERVILM